EFRYGATPGQLGAMPAGEVEAVVGSPPWQENGANLGGVGDTPALRQQVHESAKRPAAYGTSPGQLGALPPGSVEAVVGSPPWQGTRETSDAEFMMQVYRDGAAGKNKCTSCGNPDTHDLHLRTEGYGTTPGQLGALPAGSVEAV